MRERVNHQIVCIDTFSSFHFLAFGNFHGKDACCGPCDFYICHRVNLIQIETAIKSRTKLNYTSFVAVRCDRMFKVEKFSASRTHLICNSDSDWFVYGA